MALLILINGVPGSGKSTVARRYVHDHPMALALDIDVVRSMLGGWLEQPASSGLAARAIALAMARVHLAAGHDVVVPQFLGRLDYLLELEQLAANVGAVFVEVALVGAAAQFAARFAQRSELSERPEHRDAAELLARSGGTAEISKMYDRLLTVLAARPLTVRVDGGDEERVYLALLKAIASRGRGR